MRKPRNLLLFLRWGSLFLTIAIMIGFIPTTQAQDNGRFFPETNHYVRGLFRAFWESNGQVYVFGYPITDEFVSSRTGVKTQYFERARFEERTINNQPYVELGKLGSEITAGRSFQKAQPIQNTSQRRYIPQTQYVIKFGFKQIWETYGADRIFGLPISNEVQDTMPDGKVRTVQYFERARFEFWPELPDGKRVVISSLGLLLAPSEQSSAQSPAPSTPTPQPSQPAVTIPVDVRSSINPKSGVPGTEFQFEAGEFEPNEEVSIWLTGPGGEKDVRAFDKVKANDNGKIGQKVKKIKTSEFATGVWIVTAQGVKSKKQAFAYFLIGAGQSAVQPAPSQPAPSQPVSGSNIPNPEGECANHVPAPAEQAQAWLSTSTVSAKKKENIRLCVRLIINGQVIKGQEVKGVIHFEGNDVWIGPEKTRDSDGVASLKFTSDKSKAGYTVKVDAEVIYNGKSYYAQTSFTPQ